MSFTTKRLDVGDLDQMKDLLRLFGEVFGEPGTFQGAPPSDGYLVARLRDETFSAVVALNPDGMVIGGLAAYELKKFEQERSEIYIYDLAVHADHRRKGVATALIRRLGGIARECGAWVMFVQADIGEEDEAANALYRSLASEMIVANHYDIAP
ncbi:GNAT family N-acetyltransferase [Bradyrhizobium sp. LHD-71]|uniref:GNAT family N-acetyltransferase n=1 Tax=Bradyrhizobium sp. LHD-71 TaxID=3072141 RepID=UPI00280C9C2B|nr:GNAT family N-acetyltransferase [Bradyrhizobium sp. LHD-71]MDQ8732780.1 GNAT family N-acetyltransferase [Bradyrhizobium sp. LHD-71]